MPYHHPSLTWQRRLSLLRAATEFYYLQNHGYPRLSALELTGNRHRLSQMERNLLRRGVFSQKQALERRAKKCKGSEWQKKCLFIDGHNVHITIESALLGRLLLKANDGALRDLAGESARFRLSKTSEAAIDSIFRFLQSFPPPMIFFLFDSPMSHSGVLAGLYSQRLKAAGLAGDARTVGVPEREFPYDDCVIASSDTEVIDRSHSWFDLAMCSLEAVSDLQHTVNFSSMILAQSSGPCSLPW